MNEGFKVAGDQNSCYLTCTYLSWVCTSYFSICTQNCQQSFLKFKEKEAIVLFHPINAQDKT